MMEPTTPLESKTALVTGSSRNLGASIAKRLALDGAAVAITYRESQGAADAIIDDISGRTGRAHVAVRCDLSTPDGARKLIAEATERLGAPIDILVNNFGDWAGDGFMSLAESDWDKVLDTNVKLAFITSQVVGPEMKEAGWGRIINVSAGSAYVRNHSVYGLAKASLVFLTEELAVELAPEVTVNAIAPGQIAESAEEAEAVMPGFVAEAVTSTPAGRLVTRAEVADLVGEICGEKFDLVTGVTIPIDGGWRLHTA